MSDHTSPRWVREFGPEYAIPQEILDAPGFEDLSWGNNTCPCFELTVGDGAAVVVLWVEHPEPVLREDEDAPRFAISAVLQGRSEEADATLRELAGLPVEEWGWWWTGEEVEAALSKARELASRIAEVLAQEKASPPVEGREDVLTKRRLSTGRETHYLIGPVRGSLQEAEEDRNRWASAPDLQAEVERLREEVSRLQPQAAGVQAFGRLNASLTEQRDGLAEALERYRDAGLCTCTGEEGDDPCMDCLAEVALKAAGRLPS